MPSHVSVEISGDGAGGAARIISGFLSESGRAGIVIYGDPSDPAATTNAGAKYGPAMVEMGELSDGSYGLAAVNPAGQLVKLSTLAFGPAAESDASAGTRAGSAGFTWGDLTGSGAGPTVTVQIGDSGKALVIYSAFADMGHVPDDGGAAWVNFEISGATSRAATLNPYGGFRVQPNVGATVLGSQTISRQALVTGLNPGQHTFTMKYSVSSVTGLVSESALFSARDIAVFPY
jgi:hypothetical protein